jgi:uncharacterized protein GlcG (DUF336 family)
MTTIRAAARGSVAILAWAALSSAVAAQGLVKANRLSAALAGELVAAAVEACAKQDQEVTGVVVDISGVQQAMLRGDGAGINTVTTAYHKAFTAVGFKTDTIDLVKRAQSEGGRVSSAIAKVPNLLLAQGGVLIKAGDEVIGAVGISGARGNNIDTACARAGIEKIKDRLK